VAAVKSFLLNELKQTPVRAGREKSLEAAPTTRWRFWRNSARERVRERASFSSSGTSGKSSASVPLKVAEKPLPETFSLVSRVWSSSSALGRLLMNSASGLAGTVMTPDFLTLASRVSSLASSRLLAMMVSLLPSARRRTLLRMGSWLRELAMREMLFRVFESLVLLIKKCMLLLLLLKDYYSY